MSRKLALIMILSLLLSCFLHIGLSLVEVEAPDGYPVHNLDTRLNYTSIQEAINASETLNGHGIFVEEGIYYEHLVVSKSVSLFGQNKHSTIIDGSMTDDVVKVTRDSVNITGFTIRRSGSTLLNAGISLSNTMCCNISGNHIVDNEVGVYGSPRNTSISDNTIANNHVGIAIDPGATCNIISRNCLTANTVSIHVFYANSNNISKNNMTNNWRSITLGYSRDNRLYHNTFFNNTEPILILASGYTNIWDCGYPSGGNYWGNYNGTDSNLDGIGDSWYEIDENNADHYPLMGVFHSFNTSQGYTVDVVSNSTINCFEYFESNSTIKMYVSNMTVNQTFGFCRVRIPYTLMNETAPITVLVKGTEPYYWNYTLYDDGNNKWIYFNYQHSTLEIVITPEFPSSLVILPLFMVTILLAVMVCKRKHSEKLHTQVNHVQAFCRSNRKR